jgi:hypothetical protein
MGYSTDFYGSIKIDQIDFRHSVDLKTILEAYNGNK